jgi:glucose/arabinose dehydrogenase
MVISPIFYHFLLYFMQQIRFTLALCLWVTIHAFAQTPNIVLEALAPDFEKPVDITHCGDGRLFIVEQRGYIWILDSTGNKLSTPFLNIDPTTNSGGNEQGLLGLAFHPNYAENGYFYVNYIRNNGNTRIARFKVMDNNPNVADQDSEVPLLNITQPFSNHNGGCLKFGPDGYLYAALGDGGSGGDPQNFSQRKNTLLGKMLRLDVSNPNPPYYTVPADNPFVSDAAYSPEIWSLGLRNPWRFSFDRLNGNMWIADVGQGEQEEIDFELAGDGGHNYGWRCYEGTETYNTSGCQGADTYTMPVFEYNHSNGNGCSVTGGFVYRGTDITWLYGSYLFTDYCSGRWWRTVPDGAGGFTTTVLDNFTPYEYSSFGEDVHGELYVAALSQGKVYKITQECPAITITGTLTAASCTGANDGSITVTALGGVTPYQFTWGVNVNPTQLTAGTYTVTVADANGCSETSTYNVEEPVGSVPLVTLLNGADYWCEGETWTISTSAAPTGLGYQWYKDGEILTDSTDTILTVTAPGVYQLRFTKEGCVYPLSASFAVTALPIPVIAASGSAVLCPDGQPLQLQVTNPLANSSVRWFRNNELFTTTETGTVSVSEQGLYTAVFSTEGCDSPSSEAISVSLEVQPSFTVSFLDEKLRTDAPAGGQWYFNNDVIVGATDSVYQPLQSGEYRYEFSSEGGCRYSISLAVTSTNVLPAWVTNFEVSPNPAIERTNIEVRLKTPQKGHFNLIDSKGQLVKSSQQNGDYWQWNCLLNDLPAGNYLIEMQISEGRWSKTLVVVK